MLIPSADDLAACIDIGGTKALIGLVDPSGNILARGRYAPEADMDPARLVAALAQCTRALAQREGIAWQRVAGVGYASAGMMDVESGVLFASPNQGSWRDVPFQALLQDSFGLPAWIEMDANAAALGEAWLGAGQGADYFAHVIIGTGIGAGFLAQGRVLRGWRGTAGEFGHAIIDPGGPRCACGRYGCLESLASGPAIAARAREKLRHGRHGLLALSADLTAEAVFAAARLDDPLALDVVRETIDFLAIGLSNLIHILAPQVIALGGGVAIGGADLLIDPLRQATLDLCGNWVDKENTRILAACLGDAAGLLGAARVVWERMESKGENPTLPG